MFGKINIKLCENTVIAYIIPARKNEKKLRPKHKHTKHIVETQKKTKRNEKQNQKRNENPKCSGRQHLIRWLMVRWVHTH